jgi:hypothetical protein
MSVTNFYMPGPTDSLLIAIQLKYKRTRPPFDKNKIDYSEYFNECEASYTVVAVTTQFSAPNVLLLRTAVN